MRNLLGTEGLPREKGAGWVMPGPGICDPIILIFDQIPRYSTPYMGVAKRKKLTIVTLSEQ